MANVIKNDAEAVAVATDLGHKFAAGDASLGQLPQNHFFFLNVLAQAGSAEERRFFYAEVLGGKRFGNALAERASRDAHDFRIGFTPSPTAATSLRARAGPARLPGGFRCRRGPRRLAPGGMSGR
jgi:hypothetical protein